MREQKLHQILKETFGYSSFRFSQLEIINSILDARDTLAIMPTGGGKSVCYQIPALFLEGITLVISPLISLMQDQVSNLKETGVDAVFLNSSLSFEESKTSRGKILSGKSKIVYVSPEGILSPSLAHFFDGLKISLIAIDEAHCVSQWGHEFRKDYMRLGELKDKFSSVPFIALTATADEKTRGDICAQLRMRDAQVFISSFDRPNINYAILDRQDEIKQLSDFIDKNHPTDTGIVYCLSRDKVERVTTALKKLGYPAIAYHAGLPQEMRTKNLNLFNSEDRIIVVATIAFGMGIDRPDVRFVAHLDLPKSIESYYQETGRAGRDGKAASAWMIYGFQDVIKLSGMLETTDAEESYKRVARFKLDSMLALCEGSSCRRKFLLQYFGEKGGEFCGNCDICLSPPVLMDATVDAQKLLSTIYRTNQIYGAGYIIDVLRGSQNAKVLERNHDKLSVYGLGKDLPAEYWNTILRQLLNLNYIQVKSWEYKSLGLTNDARKILVEGEKFFLKKQDYSSSKKDKKKTSIAVEATDKELFEALKKLRKEIAQEKNVPPYVIFSDKTLNDMCHLLPRTESEFLLVYGVGQNKLDQYGPAFLELINSHS
jgi:ATP-dependent DNA helicase RecQ